MSIKVECTQVYHWSAAFDFHCQRNGVHDVSIFCLRSSDQWIPVLSLEQHVEKLEQDYFVSVNSEHW